MIRPAILSANHDHQETEVAMGRDKQTTKETYVLPTLTLDELHQQLFENIKALYDGFLPKFSFSGPLVPNPTLSSITNDSAAKQSASVDTVDSILATETAPVEDRPQPLPKKTERGLLKKETIGQKSLMDGELVYFGLRLFAETVLKKAKEPVTVLPTIMPEDFMKEADDLIGANINANKEHYGELVQLSEKDVLPDDPILKENERRSHEQKKYRDKCIRQAKIHPQSLVTAFLNTVFENEEIDLSVQPLVDQQFIIPIRENEGHFTVVNVLVRDNQVNIEYRDSLQGRSKAMIKNGILDFFKQTTALPPEAIQFAEKGAESKRQPNPVDCGLYAILHGLDTACKNAGLPEMFSVPLDARSSLLYRLMLFVHFQYLGMNIHLEVAFAKSLQKFIAKHEIEPDPSLIADDLRVLVEEVHGQFLEKELLFSEEHQRAILAKVAHWIQAHPNALVEPPRNVVSRDLPYLPQYQYPSETPSNTSNSFWSDFLFDFEARDLMLMGGGACFCGAAVLVTLGPISTVSLLAVLSGGFLAVQLGQKLVDWYIAPDTAPLEALSNTDSSTRFHEVGTASKTSTPAFQLQGSKDEAAKRNGEINVQLEEHNIKSLNKSSTA